MNINPKSIASLKLLTNSKQIMYFNNAKILVNLKHVCIN